MKYMMKRPRLAVDAEATYALADSGIRRILRSKLVWLALAVSAIHIAVRVAIITIVGIIPDTPVTIFFNRPFFISTIALQAPTFIVVGAALGAGTTSRDRMMGGLEFLLSKALPPWGYVVGRIVPPTVAALTLLALPIFVMNILLIALVDKLPPDAGTIMWGTFAAALLFSFTLGPLSAGLGTLTDNPRRAVALWLGVVWLTSFLVPFAFELGVEWNWAFSPITTLSALGATFIGNDFPSRTGEGFAWFLASMFVLFPVAALWWRTREVVR